MTEEEGFGSFLCRLFILPRLPGSSEKKKKKTTVLNVEMIKYL